jgi:hypothetical protein
MVQVCDVIGQYEIHYCERIHLKVPLQWSSTYCNFALLCCAYSVYSQLPSISGSRPLHLQPEDAPCRGDEGLT